MKTTPSRKPTKAQSCWAGGNSSLRRKDGGVPRVNASPAAQARRRLDKRIEDQRDAALVREVWD